MMAMDIQIDVKASRQQPQGFKVGAAKAAKDNDVSDQVRPTMATDIDIDVDILAAIAAGRTDISDRGS
jgi:hypothetical protein